MRILMLTSKRIVSCCLALAAILLPAGCTQEQAEPQVPITIEGDYAFWKKTPATVEKEGYAYTYSFLRFENGQCEQWSSVSACPYADGALWEYNGANWTHFALAASQADLKIRLGDVVMRDDKLYVNGQFCPPIRQFSKDCYSTLVPEVQQLEVGASPESCRIACQIQRRLGQNKLSAYCHADWVKNLLVEGDNIRFDVTQMTGWTERTAYLRLSCPGAQDVLVAICQRDDLPEIRLAATSQEVSSEGGSYSFVYEIRNLQSETALTAIAAQDWVTDIAVSPNSVSYKVAENASFSPRTAVIRCSYGTRAVEKEFTVLQQGKPLDIQGDYVYWETIQPSFNEDGYAFIGSYLHWADGKCEQWSSSGTCPYADETLWEYDARNWRQEFVSDKIAEIQSRLGELGTDNGKLFVGGILCPAISRFEQGFYSTLVPEVRQVEAGAQSGSYELNVQIQRRLGHSPLSVACDADWVTNLRVEDDKIGFDVAALPDGSERTANLRLSCPGAQDVLVAIHQQRPQESLSLDKEELTLCVGEDYTLTATAFPPDMSLVWSSSNPMVASVNQSGYVYAHQTGTAVITVAGAEGSPQASCTLQVVKVTPVFEVSPLTLSVAEGTIEAVIIHSNSDCEFLASSSDPSVATVSVNGKTVFVTGKSPGTAEITIACQETESYVAVPAKICQVTVTHKPSFTHNANCYLIATPGTYNILAVKGNSSVPVGEVASAQVLWESFGTSSVPSKGDIVPSVSYTAGSGSSAGTITFSTPATLKNGNALIAAKDASGNILWSWHIWVCSGYDPAATAHTYYNNAGVMMDRNLGATSATPGNIGALGLLYQWGRKDPFLASSNASTPVRAASTGTWPSAQESDETIGTIAYATSHPMTFITNNPNNFDWYYTDDFYTDDTRWLPVKTIYDPCPDGWRVPDAGSDGVWVTAIGSDKFFGNNWDAANKGINFSGKLGSAAMIWYPASGFIVDYSGELSVGMDGTCWSCTPDQRQSFGFSFNSYGGADPKFTSLRSKAFSVRCQKE